VIDELEPELRADADRDGIERVVVAAVVRDERGHVLLLRRRPDDFLGGIEELPSGRVEDGEPLRVALRRQVLEETGLRLTGDLGYLGCFDYRSGSGRRTRQHTWVGAATGDVRLSEEHDDLRWVAPADIGAAGVTTETLDLLRAAITRSRPGARRPGSDGTGRGST
jgi:8-oxo-dGTP diphosphatase